MFFTMIFQHTQMPDRFSILVTTLARSCECAVQRVMVKCISTCLPASLSLSCVLSVLCNFSSAQAGSSVFLLHPSAARCLCECVWRVKRQSEREYVLPVCVCVCEPVLQFSVAMAMLGTWLRQLHSPALPESCCRKPLCLRREEMHTHRRSM